MIQGMAGEDIPIIGVMEYRRDGQALIASRAKPGGLSSDDS